MPSGCFDFEIKPIVLVTGFGPFTSHPVNASWEAVKLMNKDEIEKKHNVELVQVEIPVTYENVDEFVPALWDTHTPKLVVHVGVSGIAECLTLETQAHRKGYKRMDYFDKCPADHVCVADGSVRITTKLNVEEICKDFNNAAEDGISAVTSCDAGRYLCEYIYYTSLSNDSSRTLFVHVPDTNIYSSEKTARGLEKILDLCIEHVNNLDNTQEISDKLNSTNLKDKAQK